MPANLSYHHSMWRPAHSVAIVNALSAICAWTWKKIAVCFFQLKVTIQKEVGILDLTRVSVPIFIRTLHLQDAFTTAFTENNAIMTCCKIWVLWQDLQTCFYTFNLNIEWCHNGGILLPCCCFFFNAPQKSIHPSFFVCISAVVAQQYQQQWYVQLHRSYI